MQKNRPTRRSTKALVALGLFAFLLLAGGGLSGCARPGPDLAALDGKSRSLVELESCEYVYHDIVYQGKKEKFLGLLTTRDTRLLFAVDIRISAGIDLQASPGYGLKSLPANDQGQPGLLISLPGARILTADADESTIQQYFIHEYGMADSGKVNWLDFQDEIQRAKERASQDAIRRGLLETAWENAAGRLAAFSRLAGFGEVRVEKADLAPATPPARQEAPGGPRTGGQT